MSGIVLGAMVPLGARKKERRAPSMHREQLTKQTSKNHRNVRLNMAQQHLETKQTESYGQVHCLSWHLSIREVKDQQSAETGDILPGK